MKPLHLTLSGFLSYRDQADLDFTQLELACISGPNGAGKSSLLDAITWVLFGQARKRDDAIINMQSGAAEVTLTFAYEGNTYRVRRAMPRGKTTQLEFHIQQPDGSWKPFTERALRETQERIEQTLRLDYETFINASFFLQGKADQFTQQRPGDRKRILGSILGLEIWETYRQRAGDRRKQIEGEITSLDGRVAEIDAELREEDDRHARLEALKAELKRLKTTRTTQEKSLADMRKVAATLAEQHRLVDALGRRSQDTQRRLDEAQQRLSARTLERLEYTALIERAGQVEAAYAAWQAQRKQLERLDEVAAQFRQFDGRRQQPLLEIKDVQARLEQEAHSLQNQEAEAARQQGSLQKHQAELDSAQASLQSLEATAQERLSLEAEQQEVRTRLADANAENPRLKDEMQVLKQRIDTLSQAEGAVCPLCGQPLDAADRQRLSRSLEQQGKEIGDRYRLNQSLMSEASQRQADLELRLNQVSKADAQRLRMTETVSRLATSVQTVQEALAAWEQSGASRLAEVTGMLEKEAFAPEARKRLKQIDAELKKLGYDAAAHEAARKLEVDSRAADEEKRQLEKAHAALAPLQREITDREAEAATLEADLKHQQEEYDTAAARLAAAEAQAPDVEAAERDLLDIQEQENRLRQEMGAAQQKVDVLKDLKRRKESYQGERQVLATQVSQFRQLEKAFSKDGVPALLIDQALPEIQTRANDLLDRLSGGTMSVTFLSQSPYKDKRREDLRETLDIIISDGAGARDYELYSGGEAFRVNFAIRLALSELLAQRSGARLQTLVIDEGFGSQDTQGRQRLIEAINLVKDDFAKILVITHIDELKDAFPNRIEVEKTERGSTIRVV